MVLTVVSSKFQLRQILFACAALCFIPSGSYAASEFLAIAADGSRGQGSIVEMNEKDGLTIESDRPFRVKNGELVELRRIRSSLPAHPAGPQLLLTCGDRISLDANADARLIGNKLQVPLAFSQEKWAVPLSAIAVFWRTPPQDTIDAEKMRRELASAPRKHDILLLTNGDKIEGYLEGWDATDKEKGLQIEVERQRTSMAPAKLAAVAFSSDDASGATRKAYMKVVLSQGGRLSLTGVTCDGTRLTGTTLFGLGVSIPVDDIAAITVHQERAVYLSDLKPSKVQDNPYLGDKLTVHNDRNALGDELLAGGQCFDKGVGMRSGTKVTYALDGKYKRLEAVVGLDDVSGRRGSVRIRILVDGKEREVQGLDKELKWRPTGVEMAVDLAGVKELTLVVESQTPVQDCVDWGNARLVK
jgi:hypothetical protein